MNQNERPMYISICTQKGGAGKSVFTTLVASYLHYIKAYNVAVIDSDYPQWSIQKMRQREAEQIDTNNFYQKKAASFFEKLNKPTYPIVPCQPEEGLQKARDFLFHEEQKYDVVFFDLPGTVNNESVVETYFAMDFLFVPIITSRINMESTLPFLISVNEMKTMSQGNLKLQAIYPFWNMVTRGNQELYDHYDQAIIGLGIEIMETRIPKSVRYDREQSIEGERNLFLSTIFPPDKPLLKGSNLEELVDEIIQLTNLQ